MDAQVTTQPPRPCLRTRQLLQLSSTTRYGSVMTAVPHWEIVDPRDTDADLVRASLGGDRTAFAHMYDRYADSLHDFCVGMLRDRDSAADCVQDAFCIAATRLPQLREPDKLRPWLYSIARNEALRVLRERRRETPSEELPEEATNEPGPEMLAARTELADLISEAAGGLSDRDRTVLELAYRHGLDGPELAEALDISHTNANTMLVRLRDTIERSLGALLVARHIRNNPAECSELAAILHGWDGHFNVLMRKRVARHVESCPNCDAKRHQMVSPIALLGAAPPLMPAPAWLRESTLSEVRLTPASTPIADDDPEPTSADERDEHGVRLPIALFLGALLISVGITVVWLNQQNPKVAPVDLTGTMPATPSASAPPTGGGVGPVPSGPLSSTSAAATTTITSPPPAQTTVTTEPPETFEPPRLIPADEPPSVLERTPALEPTIEVGTPVPRPTPPPTRSGPSFGPTTEAPPTGIAGIPTSSPPSPQRKVNTPPPSRASSSSR